MKGTSAVVSAVLLASAGAAWAGPAADDFRGLMVHDLKLQLPREAVANLQGQLELAERQAPKEDWAPVEAAVGHLEKFYHDYTLLIRPGPTRPQDLLDLRRELGQVSKDLNYRDAEMERKVNELFESHLDKMDADAKTEAAKKSIQSLRGRLTAGNGEGPFQKQGRYLAPLATGENPFTEHRSQVGAGLDKTPVPVPAAEKKRSTASAPPPPAKRSVARDTAANDSQAVVEIFCVLLSEQCREGAAFKQVMDHAR